MTSPRPLQRAALALACLIGTAAQASVISHDTITGRTYSDFGLHGGYFAPHDTMRLVGVRFTAAASGHIDALTLSAFGAEHFTLTLHEAAAGGIGASLQTLALAGSSTVKSFSSGAYDSGASLTAGQDYWLVLGEDTVLEYWFYMEGLAGSSALALAEARGTALPTQWTYHEIPSTTMALGLKLSIDDGLVSSVPEPSSAALALLGLLGGAAWRRQPRR